MTRNYSFHVGKHHVIIISRVKSRNVFYNTKDMNLSKGKAIGGTNYPTIPVNNNMRTAAILLYSRGLLISKRIRILAY